MAASLASDGRQLHAGRWRVTVLMSAAFALSYIDRQVLSLLVPSIKQSLSLSDSEIGLLQGISFSIFYVAASLPFARLADRVDRSRLISFCIAAWSVMTVACGLAFTYVQLLLARIGLAMAESGLPPAALTQMNDLHDRKGLARATSLFMLAPFVGGGLALVGGGALLEAIGSWRVSGALESWQIVFMVAGLPGLVLAPIIWLTVRDPRPARTSEAKRTATVEGSLAELKRFMLGNWRFSVIYTLAMAITIVVLNAHIAWMPAAILRRFPVGEANMGLTFGITYLVAGSVGTLLAGWLVSRGADDAMLARTLRLMGIGTLGLAPFAIWAPFASSYAAMVGITGLAVLFNSGVIAMGSIPFQIAAPPALRAQALALMSLVAALIGTGLGPLITGMVSDFADAAGVAEPLSMALAIVGGVCAITAAIMMEFVRRHVGPAK